MLPARKRDEKTRIEEQGGLREMLSVRIKYSGGDEGQRDFEVCRSLARIIAETTGLDGEVPLIGDRFSSSGPKCCFSQTAWAEAPGICSSTTIDIGIYLLDRLGLLLRFG
jgi:hypothetical protein